MFGLTERNFITNANRRSSARHFSSTSEKMNPSSPLIISGSLIVMGVFAVLIFPSLSLGFTTSEYDLYLCFPLNLTVCSPVSPAGAGCTDKAGSMVEIPTSNPRSRIFGLFSHFRLFSPQSVFSLSVSTQSNFQIAKPNCADHCGNISIPFPFGTREGCYYNETFLVTCNDTHYDPPKPFLGDSNIDITSISLEGQMRVMLFIAKDCYSRDGTRVSNNEPSITMPDGFTVSNTANKFFVIGCDTYAFVFGSRENRTYETGCTSVCTSKDDLVYGSCSGVGCCQTSIPKGVWDVQVTLMSYHNFTESYDNNLTTVWDFNNCSYGFLAEERAFTFSASNLSNLRNVKELPMVVDWAVGEETCEEARNNISSYACKSEKSECYEPDNGYGYRCHCQKGFEGNPYLDDGCKGMAILS
ncbi:unnamed protein product [Fraxinus pennsylvanica]|uniref:Wall-associated receptor kinase galacturonan-binding domain-containing protein n=1 Tax=Fraxinus pennsylvanica TaxID=56036 RepID=A0AAD2DL84_9LAMI|nr:unnamed protein product [Fraxinus pennsylvanica]